MDVPRCCSTASRTFLATLRRGSRSEHCSVVSTVSSSPSTAWEIKFQAPHAIDAMLPP